MKRKHIPILALVVIIVIVIFTVNKVKSGNEDAMFQSNENVREGMGFDTL